MGFTQQEYEQLKANLAGSVHFPERSTREPNKWEAQFADELERWKKTRHIVWYQFEAMRFRLADSTYYKPDFMAMQFDGELIAYEVKGHWREAARLRIKVASDQHPIYFIAVTKEKRTGRWQYETFGAARDRLRGSK